jgi:hypothetical protein
MIVLSLTFVVRTTAPIRENFVRAGETFPTNPELSFMKTVMHKISAKLSTMQATKTRSMKCPELYAYSWVGKNCNDKCSFRSMHESREHVACFVS